MLQYWVSKKESWIQFYDCDVSSCYKQMYSNDTPKTVQTMKKTHSLLHPYTQSWDKNIFKHIRPLKKTLNWIMRNIVLRSIQHLDEIVIFSLPSFSLYCCCCCCCSWFSCIRFFFVCVWMSSSIWTDEHNPKQPTLHINSSSQTKQKPITNMILLI